MTPELEAAMLVVGRLFLGGHFLIAAVRNFLNLRMVTERMVARGLPQARLAMLFGITVQLVGGTLLAFSVAPVIGAAALIAFTVGATVLFHNFWDYSGPDRVTHINLNLTNMALIGGLLIAIATA